MTDTPTHYERAEQFANAEHWNPVTGALAGVTHAMLAVADNVSDLITARQITGVASIAPRRAYEDMVCRIDIRGLDADQRRILDAELTSAADRCGVDTRDVHIEIEASE